MNIAVFFVPLVPIIWVLPAFVLLFYLTLASDLLQKGFSRPPLEWVDAFVLIFLILCSISFFNLDLTFRSLQNYLRYYFGTYLFPVLGYFALRLMRFSNKRAGSLRKAVIAAGLIFSVLCLFEFAFRHPINPEVDLPEQWTRGGFFRAGSLAGGSVHAGETMAAFIALTIPGLFFRWPGKRSSWLILVLMLELLGLGVVLARAGYIATLTCIFLAFLFLRGLRQQRWIPIITGLLLMLITGDAFLKVLPAWLFDRLFAENYSTLARIPRFWAGIAFIGENLRTGWQTALLGRGYLASYLWGGIYLKQGYVWGVTGTFLSGGFHNGYLTMIADQGFLAFGCYITVVIAALRRLWQYCRQFRQLGRPILKSGDALEPVGWGLILVAHLVVETVHWSFGFPQMFYFFMALAMTLNLTSPDRLGRVGERVKTPAVGPPGFRNGWVPGGFKGRGPAPITCAPAHCGPGAKTSPSPEGTE